MMPIDLSGQRYGRLTVVEPAGTGRYGRRWLCRCDCGRTTVAIAGPLRAGQVISCGCAQREAASAACRMRSTHGMTRTRIYTIWRAMKARCERPGSASYHGYGARGITVCDEWSASFEAFRDWALSNGYEENLSIDRIDVDAGYSPANCRWANPTEQANNRRSTRLITHDGMSLSLAGWARETGIKAGTIKARLLAGWSIEKALSL